MLKRIYSTSTFVPDVKFDRIDYFPYMCEVKNGVEIIIKQLL